MFKKFAFIIALALLLMGQLPFILPAAAGNSTTEESKTAAEEAYGGSLEEGGFTFDLSSITHEDITGSSRQRWIRGGINYVFERVISVLAATIGGMSVLVMSYGGLLILSSAGNENMYQKGLNYIKYSLIGLAFALGAYIIVTAVQLLIKSIYA